MSLLSLLSDAEPGTPSQLSLLQLTHQGGSYMFLPGYKVATAACFRRWARTSSILATSSLFPVDKKGAKGTYSPRMPLATNGQAGANPGQN